MTTFSEEDAAECFSCQKRPPEFRVILLGKYLSKDRGLTSDISATLVCRECLEDELSDFHESLGQVQQPVTESESEGSSLARDYALLVVPLDLSKDDAEQLIAELRTSGINRITH